MEKYFNSDLLLRKIFDVKMKPGHEMKKAYIDEVIIIFFIPNPN